MRRQLVVATAVAVLALAAVAPVSGAGPKPESREYVVLYRDASAPAASRAAIRAAGGTIVRENTRIGVATVRSTDAGFTGKALRQPALAGAAGTRVPSGTRRTSGRRRRTSNA